jgi:protein involved in polysaccharide export with SLBB domain
MTQHRVLIGVAALSLWLGSGAYAQMDVVLGAAQTGASSAAYYYISKPGEITMPINLWGYVRNPGRYEVPISTDLIQLLSYAGGPLAEADLGSVKIARTVRRDDVVRTVEYTINLNRLDKLDEKARDLEPGDTIFMPAPSFTFRDLFNVLTTAAIITAALANAVIAARGL